MIKVCSNGGATYIIGKIIAEDNLNIENLMQTFENLLLQNFTTKFLQLNVQLKFVQMLAPPTLFEK